MVPRSGRKAGEGDLAQREKSTEADVAGGGGLDEGVQLGFQGGVPPFGDGNRRQQCRQGRCLSRCVSAQVACPPWELRPSWLCVVTTVTRTLRSLPPGRSARAWPMAKRYDNFT